MKNILIACLALVAAVPAFAQSDAALGDATMQYTTTLDIMGQQLVVPATRTITKLDGRWRVVDVAQLPAEAGGGTATDTFEVAASSLLPLRRHSASMMGTLTLAYDGGSVEGGLSSMMGSIDIDTTYADVVLVGDGAAFELYLSGLPLETGFSETYPVFSPQTQDIRMVEVEVTGTETVTTAAGMFETFVVAFTPLDGNEMGASTYYVMQDAPHLTVKAVSKLGAQMGGGTATVELTGKQ